MIKPQEVINWGNIFKENHIHASAGVRGFIKELPKFLSLFPKRATRGQVAHAFYRSDIVRSQAAAEDLCDAIDASGGIVVRLGSDSYHLTREENGRYKSQMRTTRISAH
jgi:hypothetical protein